MSTDKLTQSARAVLDAWSDAGWTPAFDAARQALRAEVEASEALAAVPVEPIDRTTIARIWREVYGSPRFDASGELFAQRIAAAALEHPAPQPQQVGLSPQQEPKYTVNGHAIVNRASGEEIPADEPVFIFRARDKYAASIIGDYANTFCTDPEHRAAVEERFIQFGEWAEKHPERMKEPDTAATPPQPTAPATQAQAVNDWNIKNGLLALKQVVSELRDCSQFIDEEGEFTNALAGLGAALATRTAEAQAKSEPAALTDAQLDALMPGAAYCVDAGSGGSIPGYSTAQVRASMRAAIKLTKQDQEAANRYWWMSRRSRWVSVRADFDRNSTYVRHRVCWYANDGWHEAEGQSFEEAVDAAIAATQEQKP